MCERDTPSAREIACSVHLCSVSSAMFRPCASRCRGCLTVKRRAARAGAKRHSRRCDARTRNRPLGGAARRRRGDAADDPRRSAAGRSRVRARVLRGRAVGGRAARGGLRRRGARRGTAAPAPSLACERRAPGADHPPPSARPRAQLVGEDAALRRAGRRARRDGKASRLVAAADPLRSGAGSIAPPRAAGARRRLLLDGGRAGPAGPVSLAPYVRRQPRYPRAGPGERRAAPRRCTPGVPVVGLVGRLQPWKGQDRLLQAQALLRERGLAVHALIVGGDSCGSLAGLRRVAAARSPSGWRSADSVTLTGRGGGRRPLRRADGRPRQRLRSASRSASCCSRRWRGGVAVVAVDSGGPGEFIDDGRTGVLARSGEPAALADALEPLLRDDALRERIALSGARAFAPSSPRPPCSDASSRHWRTCSARSRWASPDATLGEGTSRARTGPCRGWPRSAATQTSAPGSAGGCARARRAPR